MDNLETLTTLGSQDTERRQNKVKNTTQYEWYGMDQGTWTWEQHYTKTKQSHIKGTVLLLLFYISVAVGSSIMNISKWVLNSP